MISRSASSIEALFFQAYEEEGRYDGTPAMHVGSFPKDFGYGGDEYDQEVVGGASADTKPRILLMGLRRYIGCVLPQY